MIKNKVSIIMPAYNAGKTIRESIDSVISQTYSDWELLIIDDNSRDNTNEIVAEYVNNDNRINYYKQYPNQGVAAARNRAVDLSNGQFIAFLDSDDIWLPRKLEVQIKTLENSNSGMSCTSYSVIDEESNELDKYVILSKDISYKRLLRGSQVGCLTVMVDTIKIDKNYLKMKQVGHEDYLTWLKIAKQFGNITVVPENLAKYRVFKGSLSGNKSKVIKWQFNIYKNELNINILSSLFYLGHYSLNAFTKYSKKVS